MKLIPVPEGLDAFLAFDEVIDVHENIRGKAAELTGGMTCEVEKATVLFEWVRDTIPHTRDAGREEVTCAASEVFKVGTGICYAKAHLLASLMRSQQIACGFCYQVYENPHSKIPDTMALHGLNGVYLASLQRWVRVDSRGNRKGICAEFCLEQERLAFPELQMLDDCVYAKPLDCIVEALTCFEFRSELWPYLPSVTATG